jgi:DNA polymerase
MKNTLSHDQIADHLNDIISDWTGCLDCELGYTRKTQVWMRSVGKFRQGGLLFIGEGPGETEDKKGVPFVGRAGELLDELFNDCGINEFVILNTVLCRPPNNRNPTSKEIRSCWPRLQRFIEILKPVTIVTLGRVSTELLLKTDLSISMGALMRKDFTWSLKGVHTCRVMPVYHPSYLLRNRSSNVRNNVALRLANLGDPIK